jgi:hypothetical protein
MLTDGADVRDSRRDYLAMEDCPDGRPTQLTPIDEGYIDYFGRPWAQNGELHFEQGLGGRA